MKTGYLKVLELPKLKEKPAEIYKFLVDVLGAPACVAREIAGIPARNEAMAHVERVRKATRLVIGPPGQRDRRIIKTKQKRMVRTYKSLDGKKVIRTRTRGANLEYHATKGWRSYRMSV